jgi:hypothetical protein
MPLNGEIYALTISITSFISRISFAFIAGIIRMGDEKCGRKRIRRQILVTKYHCPISALIDAN